MNDVKENNNKKTTIYVDYVYKRVCPSVFEIKELKLNMFVGLSSQKFRVTRLRQ